MLMPHSLQKGSLRAKLPSPSAPDRRSAAERSEVRREAVGFQFQPKRLSMQSIPSQCPHPKCSFPFRPHLATKFPEYPIFVNNDPSKIVFRSRRTESVPLSRALASLRQNPSSVSLYVTTPLASKPTCLRQRTLPTPCTIVAIAPTSQRSPPANHYIPGSYKSPSGPCAPPGRAVA